MKMMFAAVLALTLTGIAAPAAHAYAPGIVVAHFPSHVDSRQRWRHKCRRGQWYYHHKICRADW